MLDLLLIDTEEKDKKIADLELDLTDKSNMTESLA